MSVKPVKHVSVSNHDIMVTNTTIIIITYYYYYYHYYYYYYYNQNYDKILERDWLSAARFEH